MNANTKMKKILEKISKRIINKIRQEKKVFTVRKLNNDKKIIYKQINRYLSRASRILILKSRVLVSTLSLSLVFILAFSPVFIINSAETFAASSVHAIHRYVDGNCEDATLGAGIAHPGWEDGSCSAAVPTPALSPSPSPSSNTNHIVHRYVDGNCEEATLGAGIAHPGWEDGSCPVSSPLVLVSPSPSPSPLLSPEPSVSPEVTPSIAPTPTITPEPSVLPSVSPSVSPEPSTDPIPTPSIDPTPTVVPSVEPTPSIEPSVSPSPVPSPSPAPAVSSGGGGGGIMLQNLAITNEASAIVKNNSIVITWTTSHFSTSRVIYDTISGKFDSGSASPSYGYLYYKEGDDSGIEKVTFHSVTLTDIVPGMTYYYRTVSVGSLIISQEHSFAVPVSDLSSVPAPISAAAPVSSSAPSPSPISDPVNSIAIQEPKISPNVDLSIVDFLDSAEQSSDFDYRSDLARKNGIADYSGTAEQNIILLSILKNPEAISPENQSSENPGTPETNLIDEAAELPKETPENQPDNKKELQAGLASVTEENPTLSGILEKINFTAIIVLIVAVVVVWGGKGFWVKILKKEKN